MYTVQKPLPKTDASKWNRFMAPISAACVMAIRDRSRLVAEGICFLGQRVVELVELGVWDVIFCQNNFRWANVCRNARLRKDILNRDQAITI